MESQVPCFKVAEEGNSAKATMNIRAGKVGRLWEVEGGEKDSEAKEALNL